jgi:uncharacterized protein (TIGR02246 family)
VSAPAHDGPAGVMAAWAETFAARDLDAMMRLYEPDAVWVGADGTVASGLDAIREGFVGFMALDAKFHPEAPEVVEAGDLALLSSRWTLSGSGPDGAALEMASRTADVLRRQPDGRWLYVIDAPYGGA